MSNDNDFMQKQKEINEMLRKEQEYLKAENDFSDNRKPSDDGAADNDYSPSEYSDGGGQTTDKWAASSSASSGRRSRFYDSTRTTRYYDRDRGGDDYDRGGDRDGDRDRDGAAAGGAGGTGSSRHDYRIRRRYDVYSDEDYYEDEEDEGNGSDYAARRERYRYDDRSSNQSRDRYRDRSSTAITDKYSTQRDYDHYSGRNTSSRVDVRGGEKWITHTATTTIMLRSLPIDIDENQLIAALSLANVTYKDLRMMFRKDGISRGFAFLEFHTELLARQFKEFHRNEIKLWPEHRMITLHYSSPKTVDYHTTIRTEWSCIKCGGRNYPRRDYCFRCNLPREASENQNNDGSAHVDPFPCNTLVVRYLDALTEERTLRKILQDLLPIGSLICNCLIVRDPKTLDSLSFGFVECSTITDATIIINGVNTNAPFELDGKAIIVQYAKNNYSTLITTMPQWNKGKTCYDSITSPLYENSERAGDTSNALAVAQEALAKNNRLKYGIQVKAAKRSCAETGYKVPDTSTFQYEPSSGYYYDPDTGFYYDAKTQYFFNSQTKSYLYWDYAKNTYIPAPTTTPAAAVESPIEALPTISLSTYASTPVAPAPPAATAPEQPTEYSMVINENISSESGKLVVDPDKKVKMARRVAKDMEKWAKAQNRNHKVTTQQVAAPVATQAPILGADIAFSMLEKKASSIKRALEQLNRDEETPVLGSNSVVGYVNSDSDEDLEAGGAGGNDANNQSAGLISVEKKACLLCKRQFASVEMLNKHVNSSGLHKKNLEEKNKTCEYKDRAKVRRKIYGQSETPEFPKAKREKRVPLLAEPSFEIPSSATKGLDSSNIGNKLLQKMGWSAGRGLGSQGQGIVNPITAKMRNGECSGLGSRGSSYDIDASDQNKSKLALLARYHDSGY